MNNVLGGPAACFGINVNTENHDGAEAALTALAPLKFSRHLLMQMLAEPAIEAELRLRCRKSMNMIADIINNGNIAFPSDRWSVNLPSQSLFDEFTAQLQGVISGDISGDDLVKAIDTKADSIRYE